MGGEGDDRNTLAGAVLAAALAVVGGVEGVGDTAGDRLHHERFGANVVLGACGHQACGHIDGANAAAESERRRDLAVGLLQSCESCKSCACACCFSTRSSIVAASCPGARPAEESPTRPARSKSTSAGSRSSPQLAPK